MERAARKVVASVLAETASFLRTGFRTCARLSTRMALIFDCVGGVGGWRCCACVDEEVAGSGAGAGSTVDVSVSNSISSSDFSSSSSSSSLSATSVLFRGNGESVFRSALTVFMTSSLLLDCPSSPSLNSPTASLIPTKSKTRIILTLSRIPAATRSFSCSTPTFSTCLTTISGSFSNRLNIHV